MNKVERMSGQMMGKVAQEGADSTRMADRPSDAQIKLLRSLRYDGDPRALSKREASAMIDKLKTEHPF
jgi:hypothetical protein